MARTHGSCAARPTQYRWFLDQLVVVRDDERTRLGLRHSHRSRRAQRARDVAVAVARPAVARSPMRPTSIAFAEELPVPALLLGERSEEPASLIVPPRTFNAGRVLRSMDNGPERKFRLTKLLQRGGDFERVAFEESVAREARHRTRGRTNRAWPIDSRRRTSPYLQQHADNPVDWYPVGRGSARARRARRTSRSCCRSATPRATGAT